MMHFKRSFESVTLLYLGIGFARAFSSVGSICKSSRLINSRSNPRNIHEINSSLFSRRKVEPLYFWRNGEAATAEDSRLESTQQTVPGFLKGNPNQIKKEESVEKERGMGDLVKFLGNEREGIKESDELVSKEESSLVNIIVVGVLAAIAAFAIGMGISGDTPEITMRIQSFFENPTSSLEAVVETVESMGPQGYLYFSAIYTIAEILAIPAIPLTASAGYLFGVRDGTAVVLLSASVAAAVSFIIGRTFLRSYVEKLLDDYPDFKKLDRAIGEEGFKLMLLLRISPIFPFALSNYLYGVTSIEFWPYFWGTMLGFTPGTIAYVFTGEIGKSLTLDSATAEPWYFYAGILALLSGFIKVASDVATGIIAKVQDEEGAN